MVFEQKHFLTLSVIKRADFTKWRKSKITLNMYLLTSTDFKWRRTHFKLLINYFKPFQNIVNALFSLFHNVSCLLITTEFNVETSR